MRRLLTYNKLITSLQNEEKVRFAFSFYNNQPFEIQTRALLERYD